MSTRIETVEGSVRVTGEMTVYTASQIKQPMLEAIASGPANVQLDLSGVSEFDTAGVQLLLLGYREARVSGRTIELGAESKIVHEVLNLCGARRLLMDAPKVGIRP